MMSLKLASIHTLKTGFAILKVKGTDLRRELKSGTPVKLRFCTREPLLTSNGLDEMKRKC